jgi:hypothetical protein
MTTLNRLEKNSCSTLLNLANWSPIAVFWKLAVELA